MEGVTGTRGDSGGIEPDLEDFLEQGFIFGRIWVLPDALHQEPADILDASAGLPDIFCRLPLFDELIEDVGDL